MVAAVSHSSTLNVEARAAIVGLPLVSNLTDDHQRLHHRRVISEDRPLAATLAGRPMGKLFAA